MATAPPEQIEQVHAEAFSQLGLEQRRIVMRQLSSVTNEPIPDDSARSLARAATRAEMRNPGSLGRAFGAAQPVGLGFGQTELATIAVVFIGSSIAHMFWGPR